MNAFVICNEKDVENVQLTELSKESIARVSDEMWRIENKKTVQEFTSCIEENPLLQVAYVDVTRNQAITAVEKYRSKNKDGALLVIADENVSPKKYLRPSIQPQSLLLRPFSYEEAEEVVKETWEWYQKKEYTAQDYFVSHGSDATIRVPYEQIVYFESYNKKVYVNLRNKKYGFYGTLSELMEKLPDFFVRSHRSYIVNQNMIKKVCLRQGEILLEHEICIPLSRSYKPALRELKKQYEG